MLNPLASSLCPAITLGLALFAITGLAYPALVTVAAQGLFPHQAGGSLVIDKGRVIGSELIGQGFTQPRYFHGRPSAAGSGHDAMASAGSNLGPGARALHDRVQADIAAVHAAGETGVIAPDRVTASASGLDPHVSPAAALAQVPRIAAARGLPETRVRVRETVPDRVLEAADIQVVDLPPDELIQRLKDGKVHVPDEAARALAHFFSPANLSALRELALRRAAQSVDAQMLDLVRGLGLPGQWPVAERILVAVSDHPGSEALVRAAKRLADAARAPWTALNVITPATAPPHSPPATGCSGRC